MLYGGILVRSGSIEKRSAHEGERGRRGFGLQVRGKGKGSADKIRK